jgi:hypothetical protein
VHPTGHVYAWTVPLPAAGDQVIPRPEFRGGTQEADFGGVQILGFVDGRHSLAPFFSAVRIALLALQAFIAHFIGPFQGIIAIRC